MVTGPGFRDGTGIPKWVRKGKDDVEMGADSGNGWDTVHVYVQVHLQENVVCKVYSSMLVVVVSDSTGPSPGNPDLSSPSISLAKESKPMKHVFGLVGARYPEFQHLFGAPLKRAKKRVSGCLFGARNLKASEEICWAEKFDLDLTGWF